MKMRRMDRAMPHMEDMLAVISKCKVLRLAIHDDPYPYLVPLNFGYAVEGNNLTFYFHSAKRGRKIDLLLRDPRVCFELDCAHALKEGEIACKYGFYYESVIGGQRALPGDPRGKGRGADRHHAPPGGARLFLWGT